MVKVKQLRVSGFRGILAPLIIDLTRDGRPCSAVIYGRNGTGKSSLTDAWEWLWKERIDHLAKEGAEQGSYPHVSAESGDTWVEVDFTESPFGTLRLAFNRHRVTKPDRSGDFHSFHRLIPHPCHIRFADLGEFVFRTKADRYDHVARLMGFSPQVEMQKTLRRTQRQLHEHLVHLGEAVDAADQELANRVGRSVVDERQLRVLVTPCFERHAIAVDTSREWLSRTTDAFRQRIKSDPATQKYANLRSLGMAVKSLHPDASVADIAGTYTAALAPLRASEQAIKDLHLLQLYERGLRTIDPATPNRCPLCGEDYPGDLAAHIEAEGRKLQILQRLYEKAETTRQDVRNALRRPQPDTDAVRGALEPFLADPIAAEVQAFVQHLAESQAAMSRLDSACSTPVQETTDADVTAITAAASAIRTSSALATGVRRSLLDSLALEVRAMDGDRTRAQLATDFEMVVFVSGTWPGLAGRRAERRNLEAVATQFDAVVDRYAAACLGDVRQRFADISQDLSTFFSVLEESADGLAEPVLRVLSDQERSVVLEIAFHGDVVSPAYKYLSESQLNSFGLAVFLASVKHFNPGFSFLILDDVVNSLDGYKRPRLISLLKQHFADYQVLLLTHDDVWRDRITKEFPSWKRMHFRRLEFGIGPIVADLQSSMEEIERLLCEDKPRQAGQVLGPAIEDELQDLCQAFEAQVTYNRRNEYTLDPLLTAFVHRTRDKLGGSHPLSEACLALLNESGFRNLCAHEKNPAVPLTTEEMTTVFARWKTVLSLTRCEEPTCGDIPAWMGDAFRCRCGRMVLTRSRIA